MNTVVFPFSFDKEKANIIKGIAILMMMWLHTFMNFEITKSLNSFLTIGNVPLAFLIAKACNPVGIFMTISGYGLFKMLISEGPNYTKTFSRLYRMMLPYWIVLVGGYFVIFCSGSWSFSMSDILYDITAYNPKTINPAWYILPFVIMSFVFNFLYKSFNTHPYIWLAIGFVTYYANSYVYGHYWSSLKENHLLLILLRNFEFLFPMLLGAFAAKKVHFKIHLSDRSFSIICVFFCGLMFLYSCRFGIPIYPIYCFVLVILLANIQYEIHINKVLIFLGKHSLNIWFIHILVVPFAIKAKTPILVFFVLMIVSILVSVLVNRIKLFLKAFRCSSVN